MTNNLTPYIIDGTVTLSDATNPSGVKVVARNDRTIENINSTTDSNGKYLLDLVNLTSGWSIGDSITIIVRDGLEEGNESFSISSSAVNQTVDVTTSEILDSSDVSYCTIQEVYDELDGKTAADISAERVRNVILRGEAEIDARTGTSFKSNTITDEVYDINPETVYQSPNIHGEWLSRSDSGISPGFRSLLNHKPILSITSLSTNGASSTSVDDWTARTEHTGAVAGDFFVYKSRGVIEWLKNTPKYIRRSYKTTYAWGMDRDSTDSEDKSKMELVRQLSILIAIRQILQTKSHSSLFTGADDVNLESIGLSKGYTNAGQYLVLVKERIDELFKELGTYTGMHIATIGGVN